MPKLIEKGGKGKGKAILPVMSMREVADITARIQADEALKHGATNTPEDLALPEAHLPVKQVVDVDLNAIDARIRRSKKALEALDPAQRRLTGADRQKAEKRYFELCEILPDRMLTHEEMDFFPSATDAHKDQSYRQAVEKAAAKGNENSPEFGRLATEWKQLGRILWPDEPEKSNTQSLRKHGLGSGRHFKK
jgi:hypothetical protein